MQDRQQVPVSHALLRGALCTWVAGGLLALLLFPPLRERSDWFGWLPFWLVLVPLLDLALLEHLRLMSLPRAIGAAIVQARARQRRRPLRQARRRMLHRRARLKPLLAALLSR